MNEFIEISQKEYDKLREDSDLLDALFQAGVDNWEGYAYALQLMGEDE